MLYAILCYDDEAVTCAWSKEKDDAVMASLGEVLARLEAQKRVGPVARLMPTSKAKTLRKGPAPTVVDGPFAETKEQLLGFYVIECADLDEAMATAGDLAKASGSGGAFEVRPLMMYSRGGEIG